MSSNEWKSYKLGDLCQITSSKRIFSNEYVDSGVPFYRSKEIIQKALGEEITEYLYISSKRFYEIKNKFGAPQQGDILLSSVGNRSGIPYIIKDSDGDFYFKDGNLTWFRGFDEKLNRKYLLYWLKSSLGQSLLNSIMIGSAQKALTIIGLSNLKINLPSIKTQHGIAEILSTLDEKIEINRQTNATLEAIAHSVFREWFIGSPKSGWENRKFGDVVEFIKGKKPSETSNQPVYGWLPLILIETFDTGSHVYAKPEKVVITQESNALMVMDGGSSGRVEIGFSGVVGSTIAKIRVKENIIGDYFLYYSLKEKEIEIRKHLTGTSIPHMDKQWLLSQNVGIPDMETKQRFEEIASSIRNKISMNLEEIRTLANLRDALLPKLMSGEIEVSND